MKAKPTLFATDLVQKILASEKWETRRPLKPQPVWIESRRGWEWRKQGAEAFWYGRHPPEPNEEFWAAKCPLGRPGDLMWVRETWAHTHESLDALRSEVEDIMAPDRSHGPYFRADGVHEDTGLTWRPSIHMPKWLCRLATPIVEVRVERLQDITEAGATAEGVTEAQGCDHEPLGCSAISCWGADRRSEFGWLWNQLYAKDAKMPHDASSTGLSWHDNPWVWVARWDPDEILIDGAAQQALVELDRSKGGR